MKATEERLVEVTVPILIMHSENDSANSPQGVKILADNISTPSEQKNIVWFEKTEHIMFTDCERDAVIEVVADYTKNRIEKWEHQYA
jgi:carboxylesterase